MLKNLSITENYLKDYSINENGIEEVFQIKNIDVLINNVHATDRTKHLLLNIYKKITPFQSRSKFLLHSLPYTDDGYVDLRFVEGSGFYENIDGLWLYHKGGGSVEALALQKKLGLNNLSFPAFGPEYPTSYGAFSKISFLGVKRLWQLVQEFSVSFVNLIGFIEINKFDRIEQVIGRCCIPISLSKINGLTQSITDNISDKPESIKQQYLELKDGHQAAKIILAVPSPIRATDKRYVSGKWVETNNIFIRSKSLGKYKIHSLKTNPYWNQLSSYNIGSSIKNLLISGIIYEAQSAHLQNFYFIPSAKDPYKYSVAADFCDFHLLRSLEKDEIICLLFNLLAGWRIAESLGPSWEATKNISFVTVMKCIKAFFKGLLDENFVEEVADFFVLLPQLTALVISIKICKELNPSKVERNWDLMADFLGYKEQLNSELLRLNKQFKVDIENLYSTALKLRPLSLTTLIIDSIDGNINQLATTLLYISKAIQQNTYNTNTKNTIFYLSRIIIELLFKNYPTEHKKLEFNLHSISLLVEKAQVSQMLLLIKEEAIIYFDNIFRDGKIKEAFSLLDELFHLHTHILREWIIKKYSIKAEYNHVNKLFLDLHKFLSVIVVNPDELLENYLTYVFKRTGLLQLIYNKNYAILKDKINYVWNNEEIPIERKYISFRPKNLPDNISELYKYIEAFVGLEIIFHQLYMELHED